MNLTELGWDPFFEKQFRPFMSQGLTPGRVAREQSHIYALYSEYGELAAEVSGRIRHGALWRSDLPAVGDWAAIRPRPEEGIATICALLSRKSAFSRKVAGARTDQQVVAANVDTVFLVSGLDGDFNPRRIERYLALAWKSGATPVILLNKADLCPDVQQHVAMAKAIAFGVAVHPVSATQGQGLDAILDYLPTGKTAVLLGSSGVGKSTLINRILGVQRQPVGAVRESDSRGRHITAHRELILLPARGMIIDTPGLREIQMWSDQEGLRTSFPDIEELARRCRFNDCTHQREPGCAIRQAVQSGALDPRRHQSYLKLQREVRYLAARQDQKERLLEKAKWKKIAQQARRMRKFR